MIFFVFYYFININNKKLLLKISNKISKFKIIWGSINIQVQPTNIELVYLIL